MSCLEQLCHQKFSGFFITWCSMSFQSTDAIFDLILHDLFAYLPWLYKITETRYIFKRYLQWTAMNAVNWHVFCRWRSNLLFFLTCWHQVRTRSALPSTDASGSIFSPPPAREFTNLYLLITVGITWNFICFCSKCIKSYSGAEAVEMTLMLLLLHIWSLS